MVAINNLGMSGSIGSSKDLRELLNISNKNKTLIRDTFLQNPEYDIDTGSNSIKETIGATNRIDFDIFKIFVEKQVKDSYEYADIYVDFIRTGQVIDKEKIKNFIKYIYEKSKDIYSSAMIYIKLIEIGEVKDQNQINEFVKNIYEKAKKTPYYLNIYIKLIKIGEAKDQNQINEFIDYTYKKFKINSISSCIYLGLIEIGQVADKNQMKEFTNMVYEKSKIKSFESESYVKLIEIGQITDQNQISQFTNMVYEKSKTDYDYSDVYMKLIEIGQVKDQNQISQFTNMVYNNIYTNYKYTNIYIKLIEIGKVTNKVQIDQIIEFVYEQSKTIFYYSNIYMKFIEIGYITNKNQISKFAEKMQKYVKTDYSCSNIYNQLVQTGKIYISDVKIQNEDIYKKLLSKYGNGIAPILKDNILNKKNLDALDKLLQMYPHNDKLISNPLFANIIKNQLSKFASLYEAKDHRGLLDQYIYIWHKSGLDDQESEDFARYQNFMKNFGDSKDIEYYFLDSRRDQIRSIHDAIENIGKVASLCKARIESGYVRDKNAFSSQLLANIGQSNVGYEERNEFLTKYSPNALKNAKLDLDDKVNGISDPEFVKLYDHIYILHQNKQLYNQLGNLKLLTKLKQILDNKKSLQKLNKLLKSDNPSDIKKYNYFRKGIFDPRSNSELFIKLLDDPKYIYDMKDGHADIKLHNGLKPINMTNIAYSDFDASHLTDALIDGTIDKLNYFTSQYIYYIIGPDNTLLGDVQSLINNMPSKELGIIIMDYNNKNQNDKMIFSKIKSGLQNINITQQIYIQNRILKLKYPKQKCNVLLAQILPKSDPSNRFNGVNCDKFADGNGKKVVQVMNPMSSEFTIYKGSKMLINSRLTLNQQTSDAFADNKKNIENGNTLTIDSLPDEYILTADNVEAIGNHGLDSKLVHDIYTDFFSKYISQNPNGPKSIPIKSDQIYIGSMHNKIAISDSSIPNHNISLVPNSYTDNHDATTNILNLKASEDKKTVEKSKVLGIYNMGPEDIWPIANLEQESYKSIGASMGYAGTRSEILGSIINQVHQNRQNLSYVAYKDNKLIGYMLAYESANCIYINDRNCKNPKMAIGLVDKLISDMIHIDKSKNLIMRSRDTTSLSIVRKMIHRNNLKILSEKDDQIGNEKFTELVISRD